MATDFLLYTTPVLIRVTWRRNTNTQWAMDYWANCELQGKVVIITPEVMYCWIEDECMQVDYEIPTMPFLQARFDRTGIDPLKVEGGVFTNMVEMWLREDKVWPEGTPETFKALFSHPKMAVVREED